MIKVLDYTKTPITHIGKIAGVCYNSDIEDDTKNYERGIKNLENNHGRVFEYADVTIEIDEYSARAIRELYTHIIGTSRLQASTRYIAYNKNNFQYYVPASLYKNEDALYTYVDTMDTILENYNSLLELGISKEDSANILPLGLFSKVVLKINLRALIHLAEMRLCKRAYEEIRNMVREIMTEVGALDNEWGYLMAKYMQSKCKTCTEKENCPKGKENE